MACLTVSDRKQLRQHYVYNIKNVNWGFRLVRISKKLFRLMRSFRSSFSETDSLLPIFMRKCPPLESIGVMYQLNQMPASKTAQIIRVIPSYCGTFRCPFKLSKHSHPSSFLIYTQNSKQSSCENGAVIYRRRSSTLEKLRFN